MNFAAVLKPDAPKPLAKKCENNVRHLQPGWVNLREESVKPTQDRDKDKDKEKNKEIDDLDARFKRAAIEMRRRWDRWNADHGIEYDYDQGAGLWSDTDDEGGDEAVWFEEENRSDEFYNDYCSTKKSGFSAT